ncbi:signal peptide peptidase SppA [Pelobacter propionicus]|uniref:Signal peptide peptidase A, Serine peptidase, MEROPS family S49 n=1 Tax=Pelobacter propionicus (strain DSM 2379 / NBRC 103807 / OttBd1) TaxID=338966 RepID=A1ATB2_PELPD|nr:signal peptide peptidase SppA [Pelobacter propionicus]ABL00583.1 signal peptide peptidase A, Serine peptidase, MEROPS family S49 [Pelobacter propionicus DSM 2379]
MKRPLALFLASLALLVLHGCAFVTVPLAPRPSPLKEQVLEGEGAKKILLLDISGTISEKEKPGGLVGADRPSTVSLIREALQKAEKDDRIAGVILRIDSPGGSVTASDIIHHDITEFKKRRRIPVHACIMGVGASGGYYAAAAADRIIAHPTAITGSIGVILMKFNLAGLLGKLGIEEQAVKSGDKKDFFSLFRRATPEEEKLAQEIINQLHSRFLDVVMQRPGNRLSRDELARLADGRIYTAGQALQARLVDGTGYLDDVISAMRKQIKDEQARVVSYYRPGSYLGSIYDGREAKSSLVGMLGATSEFSGGSFMYLWQP